MATNPSKLTDAPLPAIRAATEALSNGGSIGAWEQAMRRAITTAHTAATIAGMADRSFGGRVRQLASRIVGARALPADDRKRLKQAIDTQLDYLAGFVADLKASKLSPAQAAARAAMYAGATRATYFGARYLGLPFYPGQGSECRSNCKCTWKDNGDGTYTWDLGAAEHCATCQSRAAGGPYRVRAA